MYTMYTCDFPLCFTGGIAAHCAEGTETPWRPREEGGIPFLGDVGSMGTPERIGKWFYP